MKRLAVILVFALCVVGFSKGAWSACCSYGCCDCSCIAYAPPDEDSLPKGVKPEIDSLKKFLESATVDGGQINQLMIPLYWTKDNAPQTFLGATAQPGQTLAEKEEAGEAVSIKCRLCCVREPIPGCGICCSF